MKVLFFAINIDATDVGEALMAYKWADELSRRVDLTVLSFQRPGRPCLSKQLPDAEVITWPEPAFLLHFERMNAGLKPGYLLLYRKVRRWVRQQIKSGRRFDICHQMTPIAARYPLVFYGFNFPNVVGPIGGSLPTPEHFQDEVGSGSWFTRLRAFDDWRFCHDPWLRKSYKGADLVLGVAPYIRERLQSIPLQRFETVLELGVEDLGPERTVGEKSGLKLLHVGRGVRTKGLRDVVRSMAHLTDLENITLTSVGKGEEIDLARAEAEVLGVAKRINFLGHLTHDKVCTLYDEADVFVFPSFRETTGGVLYEAMRAGLPIITVDYGGPGYVTDDTCAIRLPISTPVTLASDIAKAVRCLYYDRPRLQAMGAASRVRVAAEGLWVNKMIRMIALYEEVISKYESKISGF